MDLTVAEKELLKTSGIQATPEEMSFMVSKHVGQVFILFVLGYYDRRSQTIIDSHIKSCAKCNDLVDHYRNEINNEDCVRIISSANNLIARHDRTFVVRFAKKGRAFHPISRALLNAHIDTCLICSKVFNEAKQKYAEKLIDESNREIEELSKDQPLRLRSERSINSRTYFQSLPQQPKK